MSFVVGIQFRSPPGPRCNLARDLPRERSACSVAHFCHAIRYYILYQGEDRKTADSGAAVDHLARKRLTAARPLRDSRRASSCRDGARFPPCPTTSAVCTALGQARSTLPPIPEVPPKELVVVSIASVWRRERHWWSRAC